MADGRHFDNS